MRRVSILAVIALVLAPAFAPAATLAHDELPDELRQLLEPLPDGSVPHGIGSEADVHSDNAILVANWDDGGAYRQGTDLAFWGTTAVLGNYDNPGGFRLVDISNPAAPAEIGQFVCRGPQSDVSIWKNLVFVSVDTPMAAPQCGAPSAGTTQVATGGAYEGIRVVSITDRANPRQIAFVDTDCGSHTHTLVPDEANKRLLIYVLSYPLGGQGVECNVESHRKISVVEVPLTRPETARVLGTPDVSPAVGCHDVTVYMPAKLAAAACITETQMWDIADPANPAVISHIANPAINIHHSTTFNWAGTTVVIGDELGGAEASPGCADGSEHLPLGALWFYDVSDPNIPVLRSSYSIPQQEASIFCTTHNFNTVPTRSGRDVLVSAWYNGGTTVLDFTDPASIQQIGFYIGKEPAISATWSSYWYRGFMYANNFDEDVNSLTARSRGLDVLAVAHPALHRAVKVNRLNPQTMEALP
ncbi:MAG: LVIVD repeat-containing protein [Candidatus Limnocylindria bacterium]